MEQYIKVRILDGMMIMVRMSRLERMKPWEWKGRFRRIEWLLVTNIRLRNFCCMKLSRFHSQAMEREITKRRQVIELLGQGKKYYDRWAAKIKGKAENYLKIANALQGKPPHFKHSICAILIPIFTNLYITFHIFSLYGEAEIVATAYSNFGQRVKKVSNWILTFSVLRDRNPHWHVHECSRVITYCVTGSSEAKGKKCWVK